ncbi:hypothetical protein CJ030_MR5G011892 [Morella rubra]|uniref:Uncharacterized protein n=1 Tax=Morella rubra TaxID=262757 RepID=A0A6A1VIQ6_9ROSI|nr:hypothetical protein CJ030_MR5G011892 [Morella rubra]
MMSIRFITLSLMLILLHVRDSRAQTHEDFSQGNNKRCFLNLFSADLHKAMVTDRRGFPTAGRSRVNVEQKELSNGVLAAVEVGEIPGGRKMATKRAPGGMMKEVAGLKGDDISRIKGVAHYLGNCKHVGGRKGTLKANCKPRKLGHAPPVDVGMAGFAVFSSDYHLSRPHPPKNN